MSNYFLRLKPYLLIFLITQTILRTTLLMRGMMEVEIGAAEAVQIFARGLWLDIVTALFVLLPIAFLYLCVPAQTWTRKAGRRTEAVLRFVFMFILLFGFIAEHLFWSEFSTRFNFIAVDYLIYTQEVIGNVMESYPVGWLIGAIALVAMGLAWVSLRGQRAALPLVRTRAAGFAVLAAASFALYSLSAVEQAQFNDNAISTEVAANGVYNLFNAYWHNEINYERFYVQHDKAAVKARMKNLLDEEGETFEADGITRIIRPKGVELHKNVMLVVMESMSAEYMGTFGGTKNLTPNLDRLATEGFSFSQAYATGTRTVRGLEALTLSVPPTPGQSIIRRPNNSNLFSLGFIFKDRGYDTKFIYGGYGYFDNMNAFFKGNGFDIVDRTTLTPDEIHFANVWGVADDDMFARSLREADDSYAAGRPFMHLIMTTSNHRPFTYPDGMIDIPSKTGRDGGVKFADYSVGKFMEWAKAKPWYKDTVFIFVADHTAGAAGKSELDPRRYHIPMILYAPGFITQGKYEKIASQIDLPPILLGQLNFHYRTKFYGEDLLHDEDEVPHAFISNFQKIALVKQDRIIVLSPKQLSQEYSWPEAAGEVSGDQELIDDTIAYYQSASWWHENRQRVPTVLK